MDYEAVHCVYFPALLTCSIPQQRHVHKFSIGPTSDV